MESREHLIKLLDKPKARKYRDAGLFQLSFDKLETVKPGAVAELNKRLIGPPPEYLFYSNFTLGHSIKLTKAMADEIIKMGIPDSVTIKGGAEPEALLALVNEMTGTKRLNRYNKALKFGLGVASPIEISGLLKLAESLTLDQQDKLADDLDKLDIYLYTNVHKRFGLASSALKSVKLVAKALDLLGSDIQERLGSVGGYRAHREWRPSGSIIDRAAWVFTETDNSVLVEGITSMLAGRINKMAAYEVEREFAGAGVPVKLIQITSMMSQDTYAEGISFVPGVPHRPNVRTSGAIYKAISLIKALKDRMIEVKLWTPMASPGGDLDGLKLPNKIEAIPTGVEYATIKIVAELDSTLARITTKDISSLIDDCHDLTVYSFAPCLPNSGKFYDATVESPAAIDIMELEQVKDPSRMLTSKGINLNGVNLSNVVGADAQSRLQQFITACLIGPPTDRKQELYSAPSEASLIQLNGTFKINQVQNGNMGNIKMVGIHVASGTDVTYENVKPILKALESIENLVTWLANDPTKDVAFTDFVQKEESHSRIVDILSTKLQISNKLAMAIADISSILPRCGLVYGRENAEHEAKAGLANYLSHAIAQASIIITIPANCRVSTRLATEIKEFYSNRSKQTPSELLASIGKPTKKTEEHRFPAKVWRAGCNNYYYGPSNHSGGSVYETMRIHGIDEAANSLDEAFALDKLDKLKNSTVGLYPAGVYAGLPCVGFDKDNNYVFKIKELSEVCTAMISSTNQKDGSEPNDRAVINVSPCEASSLYVYLRSGLDTQFIKTKSSYAVGAL